MVKKNLFVICVMLLVHADGFAQDRYIEIVQRYGRPQFYLEVETFPAQSLDSARVIASMRISYDNIVFSRRPDGRFSSELVFSTEFLNTTTKTGIGRSIARRIAVVDSFSETKDRKRFLEATFDFTVKADDYEAISEVYSEDLQKQMRGDRRRLMLKSRAMQSPAISDPVLVYKPQINGETISMKFLGVSGNGVFGREFIAVAEINSPDAPLDEVSYELYEKQNNQEKLVEKKNLTKEQLIPIKGVEISSSENAEFPLFAKKASTSARYLALIDFRGERLSNTRYLLKVTAKAGGKTSESRKEFDNAWTDMPYALYDIDIAIRLMEYILKPEELNAMLDGSSEERQKKFLAYWKQRDPSPQTEYNEMMAEYYRRVDYAFFNFYTNREFGWRTDRGKTYILFGEPSKISREFPINRPTQEVWVYDEIKTKFVFADRTNTGNYERIAVEKLP